MIIQHISDKGARAPQKPTEAKPLSVSDFSRDGKRTDIYQPPKILPDPSLEIPYTLTYHILQKSQGIIIHFSSTGKFFFHSERQNN